MTSPNETELWSALSRQWQTLAPDGERSVAELRAYVDRHRRRLRWLRLLDMAVSVVALGAAVWFFMQIPVRSAFSSASIPSQSSLSCGPSRSSRGAG